MAPRYRDDLLRQIQSASDIVDVISQYLPLKRAGKSFKALCPFHQEKTPSFTVNPELQIYKCFGCGKGGDVFSFIMAYERVTFPEALRIVAEKYGIEVRESKEAARSEQEKSALFRVNRWAARIFKKHLWSEEGAQARDYLTGRGFSKQIIEQFLLGYAPPGWENLLLEAKKRNIPISLLEKAGLVIPRAEASGYYDRFRNRLIFPILDARERTLGFGGRALGGDEPKYLNSPESTVFSKGSCLYGLAQAREVILKERRVALVEGYTDCLMAHEKGIKWVVATLGTALTPFHLRLLRRYADEAVLVFDADSAGVAASDRGLDIFLAEEMDGKVAVLAAGLDPCDLLEKEGPEGFLKLISGARELFDWKLETFAARLDLDTARGRNEVLREMTRLLEGTKSALGREMLIARSRFIQGICDRLGVSEQALRQRLRPHLRPAGARSSSATERGETPGSLSRPAAQGRLAGLERELLEVMLQGEAFTKCVLDAGGVSLFPDKDFRRLAEATIQVYQQGERLAFSDLMLVLAGDSELKEMAVNMLEEGRKKGSLKRRLNDCLFGLKKERERRETAVLKKKLLASAKAADEEEEKRLLREYQKRI